MNTVIPLTLQAIIAVVKKKRLLNDVNPSATPGVRAHNLLFIDSGEIRRFSIRTCLLFITGLE